MILIRVTAAVLLGLTVAGCGTDAPAPAPSPAVTFDQALHDELVAMLQRDQAARTGGADPEGDTARTERLRQILAQHGWPGFALVGRDGGDAAWAIAQHADTDLPFQKHALDLLTAAAKGGQASWGNVAYLTDRVAVAEGRPQTYGTQVGCGPDGPKPNTPIADEGTVDQRRAKAGLAPLADYYAEMTAICQEEEPPS
ncbi:DUF6624 domain-containing protein [Spirilliplanes yamanashiensis]|uniref:Lipoprotein n=1 Tax=Spirilliplanes yamanashiensis TaxID=42233 RepID=A0A8J4DK61_9ACTN|nr:DUF6624 domain-containing protein [Spirilliplanes yamanashiensis]MDP9815704.1 hypothetical protein [Spirilliplanes yamanashiensis]GIJ03958.1 hypothetical protein Sya03_33100 [Spirilliplanes yamanashiensis]